MTQSLVTCTLVIQFKDISTKDFRLHQFDVRIHGGCEIMVHGVQTMLNLHPYWVVLWVNVHNAFNMVSRLVIFQHL
jgi:hypothetical protein